jgi:hypothetical protein
MNTFIGFSEIAGVIVATVALAIGLEWIGLTGLMAVMPSHRNQQRQGR